MNTSIAIRGEEDDDAAAAAAAIASEQVEEEEEEGGKWKRISVQCVNGKEQC